MLNQVEQLNFCVSGLLTSASVMDTRLVSMVGCRAMRLRFSCRDIFRSDSRVLLELVALGGPGLWPLGGVIRLAATFMAATRSASSPLCSESSSGLQAVSTLMVLAGSGSPFRLVDAPQEASLHWMAEMWRYEITHNDLCLQKHTLQLQWMYLHLVFRTLLAYNCVLRYIIV